MQLAAARFRLESMLHLHKINKTKIIHRHCKKNKSWAYLKLRQPLDFWVLSTYFCRRFSTFCCINLKQQVEKTKTSAEAGYLKIVSSTFFFLQCSLPHFLKTYNDYCMTPYWYVYTKNVLHNIIKLHCWKWHLLMWMSLTAVALVLNSLFK